MVNDLTIHSLPFTLAELKLLFTDIVFLLRDI